MRIRQESTAVTEVTADAVAVGVYEGGELSHPGSEVDRALGGALGRLVDAGEIRGKSNELLPLYERPEVKAPCVLLVGLGRREELDAESAYRAAGTASRFLARRKRSRVAFYLDEAWPPNMMESAVCGAVVGCQGQDLYRREKRLYPFDEVLWLTDEARALDMSGILGDSVNLTRRLVNEPAQQMFPASFAQAAEEMAETCGLDAEVWDREALERERCGALLAVAQGSARPPRLVMLRHRGASPGDPTLALVGKGVTFDSGGLSIKPSDGMKAMKCDMAGAATVLGAMTAIARLEIPVNVLGLMGLVENMPGGNAYKLGDILTARSGKTIEVHNTDAEGRLVLADVLSVAVDQQVAKIIDLATLTGACVVALGMDVSGLMTNDQAWCDRIVNAAHTCGEAIWQLPMFKDFGDQIRGDVADIKNVGDGRWGGAITAAKFLEEFVGETPWAHIDIAGPAFLEKPKPWLDAGATGALVRTLVEVARGWDTTDGPATIRV